MFSHLFSSYTSRKIVINFEVKRSVGEGGEVVTDKQHSSAILNTFAGMYLPIRRTDKQTTFLCLAIVRLVGNGPLALVPSPAFVFITFTK